MEGKLPQVVEQAGALGAFTYRFFRTVLLPPYEFSEVRKHMDELGAKSLPLVGTTGVIMGLILAIQSRPVLARFGAEMYVPALVSVSVIRELGPVITGLVVAGRVSSGIGAELGSMRVTEQIDAMEVSGVDPFRFLVVTRVVACTLLLPLLTGIVNVLAILGAYIAELTEINMSSQLYFYRVVNSLWLRDVIPAITKTLIFGFIIGIVGCYQGYHAAGGTAGVGRASTSAVVISSLTLLFTDMVLVKVIVMLWG
jgi:phospholipid/cholesterol/gamma-HCH transport system permease protein